MPAPDLIIVNAKVTTLDRQNPSAEAIAIHGGRFLLVGNEAEARAAVREADVIDAKGRRVIPGLIDNQSHIVRGELSNNMELRRDGVPSLHATFDETVDRAVDVFEVVNRDVPLQGINWFFDHVEAISDRNIDRVAARGRGIAVQQRMTLPGEYFVERHGANAAERTPPTRRIQAAGLPQGAGTDATRVASSNSGVSLSWPVTSITVGGLALYLQHNRLDRETALRLWAEPDTWFSNEEGRKGQIKAGRLADPAVLSDGCFAAPERDIVHLSSVLTLLGGRAVYGAGDCGPFAPDLPAPIPDWSPVATVGGHSRVKETREKLALGCGCAKDCGVHGHDHAAAVGARVPASDARAFCGAL